MDKILSRLLINFRISSFVQQKLSAKSICVTLVITFIGFSNESTAQVFTPIDAVADTTAAVNGLAGGTTTSLTSNDTLNGDPVIIGTAAGNVTLTEVSVPSGLTLNANGTVTVAPNTPAGSYSLTYKICEVTNPTNCNSVVSTIVVSAPAALAVADTTAAVNGLLGGTTTSLTANDTLNGTAVVIGTAAGNVTLTEVSVPAGLTLNANGTVTVAPNTPAGSYSLTYKICEVRLFILGINCNSVVSTIVVSAPVIDAVADTTPAVNGLSGGTTTSLTSNDTLNGTAVVIGTAAGNVTLTGVSVPAGLTLNANGTVTVAPNTAVGNYSLTYKICIAINTANCDSVVSTIVVSASASEPTPVIDAVTDTTAAVNGLSGGTTTSLTANDTLDENPVVIGTAAGNVTLTEVSAPAGLTLNANGTVTVAPNTPAGSYSLTYKICEVNNTANCDSVVSTIVVSAPVIDAVADTTAAVNGLLGGTTTSLTANDTLDENPVVIGTAAGNVTLTEVSAPAGLTLNANGTVTVAPNTPAGSYSLTYKICEVTNPTNCDSVVSTIVVSASASEPTPKPTPTPVEPPVVIGKGNIKAVTDATKAVDGKTGGTTTSLASNDTLNGSPVVIGTAAGNVTIEGVNVPRWLTLNTDGTVTIAPNTPAVEFNLEYKICEVDFSSNCSSVVSTILVASASPDFTPTIEINSLVFASAGSAQDFVINISEIWGAPSDGQVVVNLQKTSAFKISYDPNATTSNVNGGVSVHNNKWEITEDPFWITMKLKESVVIGAHAFSTIGLTITRKPNVPNKTMQSITATIVNKSGSDGNSLNNTYNITVVVK